MTAFLMLVTALPAFAQERTITGRVTAAGSGQPLAGIEVLATLPGGDVARPIGASVTSADGSFSLRAPAGAVTLTFRSIGYQRATQDVPAGTNQVTATLQTDVLNLDEVVVTGAATGVARRNLANAVSTVSAAELNTAPAASIENQLAAKVAGADVQMNSGAPGGGNQINLRGVSTIIGASTPLYVVDGVIISDATIQSGTNSITGAGAGVASTQDNSPNRIADLNPADIENIEVLKGASAAAIYGSKASNGVIIITTKRGKPGAVRYHLAQRFGVSQLTNGDALETRAFATADQAAAVFGNAARQYFTGGGQTFDNVKALAGRNAPSRETVFDISGGTDNTRYMISSLLKNDEGIVNGTYYDKYSLRLNLDQVLRENLMLSLSTNLLRSKTGRGFTNNDNTSTAYFVALTSTPNFIDLRQNADGTYPVNPFANSNPLQTAALAKNDEQVSRAFGAARLDWEALSAGAHSLRVQATAGADYFSQKNVVYAPEDLQFEVLLDGIPGTSVLGTGDNTNLNLGSNLVYSYRPESGRFTSTTSGGVQYEYFDQDVSRWVTQDLFPGQQNVDEGVLFQPDQNRARSKDIGIFAQEELLIDERLLLTGGLRADRSSDNALTNEWYFYPKASASYRLTTDALPVLDEFKVRAAWGQAGNQPLYGQKFNVLATAGIVGLQRLGLGNTAVAADLRPELQTEIEGGVDLFLFDSRASLELTAYRRRIDDLLLTRALPGSTGFTNALYNMSGYMTTRGLEAALSAAPIQGAFSWTTRATFSRDRTIVDSLDVPPFSPGNAGFGTSLGAVQIRQGKSPTQIVGRDTVAVAGDPRCKESLGETATCGVGTRFLTPLGDANPDFRMGFLNTLQFRNLSLSSTVDWQKGGDIVNLTRYLYVANRNSKDYDDACPYEGCSTVTVGGQTRPETKGEYENRIYPGRTSKLFIEDGSFVKLREVALNWDVPQSLYSSVLQGVRGMRLSLAGRNLATWTDYTGFDPEVNNFGSQPIRANIDVSPYPPSRTFWLSVDVNF